MVALKNIHSLSDFVRHSKSHLARLSRTGEPAVLTVNGEARAVVLSADAYQKLVDDAELAENLEIIEEGMREAKQGKGIPGSELIRRLPGPPRARKSA